MAEKKKPKKEKVAVVRCKDCVWRDTWYCGIGRKWQDNFFCADGVRKEQEDETQWGLRNN